MPPRAQRLYPRMRERPPEFRVNPAWPFFKDIVALLIAVPSTERKVGVAGPFQFTCTVYGDHFLLYDGYLSRFVSRYVGNTTSYAIIPSAPYTSIYRGYSQITWLKQNYESGTYPQIFTRGNFTQTIYRESGRIYYRFYVSGIRYDIYVTPIELGRWYHAAWVHDGTYIRVYDNGVNVATRTAEGIPDNINDKPIMQSGSITYYAWPGDIADSMILSCNLLHSAIQQLADPSNVDLRVGGIPLILPPRRRLWPVVPVAEYIKHRQLGLRVGSREAVT